jgi:hypothetical protein
MEYIYELLVNSIDYIVDSETVHQSKDFDRDDLIEFIMNLTAQQFNLLQEFLEKMPILTKVVKNVCKKCKYDHTITISGYQSFFV